VTRTSRAAAVKVRYVYSYAVRSQPSQLCAVPRATSYVTFGASFLETCHLFVNSTGGLQHVMFSVTVTQQTSTGLGLKLGTVQEC
jgi:hypothetical protein